MSYQSIETTQSIVKASITDKGSITRALHIILISSFDQNT